MLQTICLSVILILSFNAQAEPSSIPESMAKTVERATNVIRSHEGRKERFKSLATLKDVLSLSHKRNLGRGKRSYNARYFYFILKPVIKMKKASECSDVKHQLLYVDSGPTKPEGTQEVLPETQYALDLLDAVCG